jgi:hypothetical protein
VTDRPDRSEEELRQAAKIIDYAVEQIVTLLPALANPALFGTNINNAILESFLMHYRTIRAFLYPSDTDLSKPDTVLAKDYLATWQNRLCGWVPVAELEKERLDRALAHFSYSRLRYQKEEIRDWPFPKMALKIKKELEDFIAELPPRRRAMFGRSEYILQSLR